MKVVKKRENIEVPTFRDLDAGDVFFSPCADESDEPYMKTDEYKGFSDGGAINLTSGLMEGFDNTDAVTKVEATLTIE